MPATTAPAPHAPHVPPRLVALAAVVALGICAPEASAQTSNLAPISKHCWAENIGWLNARDAGDPAASQGLLVTTTVLSGFIWSENVGWINLGDGSPSVGVYYDNTTGADFGVNIEPESGALSGLAWGENIGWINFDAGAAVGPATAARLTSTLPRRFTGFAWSENVGWINLSATEPGKFLALRSCTIDVNNDGFVEPGDLDEFITAYFSSDEAERAACDFNQDGLVEPGDLDEFITAYFDGC